jgi:hypothetical protein
LARKHRKVRIAIFLVGLFLGVTGTIVYVEKHLPDEITETMRFFDRLKKSYYIHNMTMRPDSDCQCGDYGHLAQACFRKLHWVKR